jgi:hypothetical protein
MFWWTRIGLAPLILLPMAQGAGVDFAREVRPILAEHCYSCHGPDASERKSELRLDQRDAALQGGKSQLPAIVPGRPDASELLLRIISTDPEEVMPPPDADKPLQAGQKETLRRWVAAGAEYAPHWAFVPPVKGAPPGPAGSHPIDAFVAARLAARDLAASAPADAAALCRRLYLDLTGLPPSPQDVAAFATAAKAGLARAVEETVDRLLATEAYGERWARVWLDVARYADTNGFEKDLPREQWAWRDWVIGALNRDLPYDQFLIEQIAGDLLPDATPDQVVATGFLRNGLINEEGAIVAEQFRIEGIVDRLDCIGKAALGLTLQCAQCHTHKFDPITHDEYFGAFAFLNNAHEAQSWVYTPPQRKELEQLIAGLRAVDERSRQARPRWQEELAAWVAELQRQRIEWTPLTALETDSTGGLNHPVQLADLSILTVGHPTVKGGIYVISQPALAGATGLRVEALTHGDLPFDGPGHSRYGTWAVTELEVFVQPPGSDKWEKVGLQNATADFSEPARGLEPEWKALSIDPDGRRTCGPVAFMIDGSEHTAWRADRGPGRRNQESVAVVQFERPLNYPAGTRLKLLYTMNHGEDTTGRGSTMLGRARFSLTNAPDPRAAPVDYAAILALEIPADRRTASQEELVYRAWRAGDPEAAKFNDEAAALWKKFPAAQTSVLHLEECGPSLARTTHLLERGAWDRPKHPVEPHVPAVLHPMETDGPRDRLAFARWIADRRSPLAARVAVNRVWQALFGLGLVETPEDFGTRAPLPEYGDLLDWLAVDFMEQGWSQKRLIRAIVTSRTYQQDSRVTPLLLERDPGNRLLARGPRFRADAEMVRDIALAAAGLLTTKVGGPSVFPPVPENVLSYNYVKVDYWHVPDGPERYRRSLYLFRKRSMPDPMLTAFDAPNADLACARRARSNTPMAALTSLNEPIFVEAAQGLARRIWREGGTTDAERIAYGYRLCTARSPAPAEVASVQRLLADTRERLRRGELNATTLAFASSLKPAELPADATPIDLAAWTIAGRVLLNLDETLTKN